MFCIIFELLCCAFEMNDCSVPCRVFPTCWMLADAEERRLREMHKEANARKDMFEHRRRQRLEMGKERPTELVAGILYDLDHLHKCRDSMLCKAHLH